MKILPTRNLLFAFLVMLLSCKKEEKKEDNTDYPEFIVFGQFQSENFCNPAFNEACVEIFKLESGRLSEDGLDDQPTVGSAYNGNYSTTLSQTDYSTIEALFKDGIPADLLDRNSGYVGPINSGTSFFWYFEYKTSNTYKYWVIDGSFGAQESPEIQTLINKISQAINIASF